MKTLTRQLGLMFLPADRRRVAEVNLAWWLAGGYRLSGGHVCLRRLVRRYCQGLECTTEIFQWADHTHLWCRAGRVVALTSEPYSWSLDNEVDLMLACLGRSLDYAVLPGRSWHNPPATTLIIIAAPREISEIRRRGDSG